MVFKTKRAAHAPQLARPSALRARGPVSWGTLKLKKWHLRMSNFDLTFFKVYIYAKGWPGINLGAWHESWTHSIVYPTQWKNEPTKGQISNMFSAAFTTITYQLSGAGMACVPRAIRSYRRKLNLAQTRYYKAFHCRLKGIRKMSKPGILLFTKRSEYMPEMSSLYLVTALHTDAFFMNSFQTWTDTKAD